MNNNNRNDERNQNDKDRTQRDLDKDQVGRRDDDRNDPTRPGQGRQGDDLIGGGTRTPGQGQGQGGQGQGAGNR